MTATFTTSRDEWEAQVDVLKVIGFEGIAQPGEFTGTYEGGDWEFEGVIFNVRRRMFVVSAEYNGGWCDCGSGDVLEAATTLGDHQVGPGGPLLAIPPLEIQQAVSCDVFTVDEAAQPVLVRYKDTSAETIHEHVLATYPKPRLAFIGIIAPASVRWVEFRLGPGARNTYLFLDNFAYGMPR